LRGGCKADDLSLQRNYCCEIQRSENWIKSAESSKEGYGSKMAVLPMIMMMEYSYTGKL
jgi:hypothetical protein